MYHFFPNLVGANSSTLRVPEKYDRLQPGERYDWSINNNWRDLTSKIKKDEIYWSLVKALDCTLNSSLNVKKLWRKLFKFESWKTAKLFWLGLYKILHFEDCWVYCWRTIKALKFEQLKHFVRVNLKMNKWIYYLFKYYELLNKVFEITSL